MQTLTAREHAILSLLAKSLRYKEIADQPGISTNSVRAHLHANHGKLHILSRTEAVVKFLRRWEQGCPAPMSHLMCRRRSGAPLPLAPTFAPADQAEHPHGDQDA